MIPYVPLHPHSLALKFNIYQDGSNIDNLEGKAGYCLVIFQERKFYYLKRSTNLKNYLIRIKASIQNDNKALPQCMQGVLKRHRDIKPVIYYLEDSLPSTLYQIHNMLSPVGWVNLVTRRGNTIKEDRQLCIVHFNHQLRMVTGVELNNNFEKSQEIILKALRKRITDFVSPKLTIRVRNHLRYRDLTDFLDSIKVVSVWRTPYSVPFNKLVNIAKVYNDDCLIDWINAQCDDIVSERDLFKYVA